METRMLPVVLTDDERRVKGDDLARLVQDRDALKDEAAAVAKEFKGRIEGLETDIKTIAAVVRSGRENRAINCALVRNEERLTMDLVREDTAEVVSSRPMTEEERQPNLFVLKGKREKAPEADAAGA